MAIVTYMRGGVLFNEIDDVLANLRNNHVEYKILFLDASDDVLIRRYKENRRKHPLTNNSEDRLILIKRGIGAIFQNCIPVDGSDTHATTRQRKDIN